MRLAQVLRQAPVKQQMVGEPFMDSMSAADKVYASLVSDQSQQRASLSNYALVNGVKNLQNQNYTQAINEFRKAISLNPESTDAYNYLGNTYLQLNRTSDAIATFKQVVQKNPTSPNAYKNLGNAYLQAKNFTDAEKQFKTQASLDPISTYPYYTLGLMYSQNDRLGEAAAQFTKVINLDRKDSHGYYGLGMVYNQMGRPDDAIAPLEQAIALKKDFADAYYQLGTAYNATGRKDDAYAQLTGLYNLDTEKAATLENELRQPRIIAGFSTSLDSTRGPGTLLSSLSDALIDPNSSTEFTMTFQFDSEMDAESVQNIANWSIRKASGGNGGFYNNGVTLSSWGSITIPTMPSRVVYDSQQFQATVTFSLSQNEFGTGTVDPSHMVFKFSGTDISGKAMDDTADEFDGFAAGTF